MVVVEVVWFWWRCGGGGGGGGVVAVGAVMKQRRGSKVTHAQLLAQMELTCGGYCLTPELHSYAKTARRDCLKRDLFPFPVKTRFFQGARSPRNVTINSQFAGLFIAGIKDELRKV